MKPNYMSFNGFVGYLMRGQVRNITSSDLQTRKYLPFLHCKIDNTTPSVLFIT